MWGAWLLPYFRHSQWRHCEPVCCISLVAVNSTVKHVVTISHPHFNCLNNRTYPTRLYFIIKLSDVHSSSSYSIMYGHLYPTGPPITYIPPTPFLSPFVIQVFKTCLHGVAAQCHLPFSTLSIRASQRLGSHSSFLSVGAWGLKTYDTQGAFLVLSCFTCWCLE